MDHFFTITGGTIDYLKALLLLLYTELILDTNFVRILGIFKPDIEILVNMETLLTVMYSNVRERFVFI